MSKSRSTYSANTIFHYTNTIHRLIEILKTGFIPYYCLEDYSVINTKPTMVALPMVSFCDVPLSRAYTPMSKYGYYAVGMKKEWAIKNRITPLLYSTDKSPITSSVRGIYHTSVKKLNPRSAEKKQQIKKLLYFISFIKPYQGLLKRGNKIYPNYRFYDEREGVMYPIILQTGIHCFRKLNT